MGWTAEFQGGPVGKPEHRRHFAAPHHLDRLWFAKVAPADFSPALQDGWTLIGMEPGIGAPTEDPDLEVAEYVLDREQSTLGERTDDWQYGEHEGVAVYVYVEPDA